VQGGGELRNGTRYHTGPRTTGETVLPDFDNAGDRMRLDDKVQD